MALPQSCCRNNFAALSRAAAKALSARFRQMGLSRAAPDWARRAAECERCPMRVVRAGTSFCGRPFLENIDRDPAIHGCGCPTHAKARDPREHCPLDARNRPAARIGGNCSCRWCALTAG